MAEVRFEKGSDEWKMFTDFWRMCQKYWGVENSDEYWDSLIDCTNEFYEKYKHIPLARRLALSLVDTMEDVLRERRKTSG